MFDLHMAYRRNHFKWNENSCDNKSQLPSDEQVEGVSTDSQQLEENQYHEPAINPSMREFLRAATD